jgi:hypothetical protein
VVDTQVTIISRFTNLDVDGEVSIRIGGHSAKHFGVINQLPLDDGILRGQLASNVRPTHSAIDLCKSYKEW